jgi:ribosomal protein S1
MKKVNLLALASALLTRRQSAMQSAIAALRSGASVKAVLKQLAEFGIFVTAQTRYGLISLLSHE